VSSRYGSPVRAVSEAGVSAFTQPGPVKCQGVSMTEITADEAVAGRAWLGRNQFDLVSTRGGKDAAFGDQQEVWVRDGTLIRLTRDRGQWWADVSRQDTDVWLDAFEVGGALGEKSQLFEHRLATAAIVDDRVFGALVGYLKPSPS
jgi:hypothetical protein